MPILMQTHACQKDTCHSIFSFGRKDVLLKIIHLLLDTILTYVKITTWSSSTRKQYSIPKSYLNNRLTITITIQSLIGEAYVQQNYKTILPNVCSLYLYSLPYTELMDYKHNNKTVE